MIDILKFNIRDENGQLLCPCCGFPGFANVEAYDEHGGIIGTAICPCCLWEPGFDDVPAASADAKETVLESVCAYRAKWMQNFNWRGKLQRKPEEWSAKPQTEKLFELAPHVCV